MALNLFDLFLTVLKDEADWSNFSENGVIEENQKKALQELLQNYSIEGLKKPNSLNFNRLELRCAYLFLYSTSHAHMVIFAMTRYRQMSDCAELVRVMDTVDIQGSFNITSLGGGPGSDPVGMLVFLDRVGLINRCSSFCVKVVDAYHEWESPFKNLMNRFYSPKPLRSEFMVQNLLAPLRPELTWHLRETHFLSMLKFLSAIFGNEVDSLQSLMTIFGLLPVGALVLIIDNSGGKAFKQTMLAAKTEGLQPVFGPVCHLKFQVSRILEPHLKTPRFGVHAQTHCTISIMILQKIGHINRPNPVNHVQHNFHRNTRYGLANRHSMHPYAVPLAPRPFAEQNGGHYLAAPAWFDWKLPPRPLPERTILHPQLHPNAHIFAQNVCNSFGTQPIYTPAPWLRI